MQSLPVIDRELRVAARRSTTYRQRVSLGGVAAGSVMLFAIFNPSPQAGQHLFFSVSWVLFVFCILEGIRQTADSLAQERREGTLGLLFLTDLKFYDLVLGKLAAAMVKSFAALLSVLPAIMMPVLLGGVTAQQCFRVSIALAMTLFLSMASGLLVSAKVTSAFAAFLFSIFFTTGLIFLPAFLAATAALPEWVSGPFVMLSQAIGSGSAISGKAFWHATLYSALLSCGLLCLCAFTLSRNAYENSPFRLSKFWLRLLQPSFGLSDARAEINAKGPAVWLAERALPGRRILWIILATVIVTCFAIGTFAGEIGLFALFPIQILFGWFIKLWMTVIAVQPFHAARRSGSLEQILCTPLTSTDLIRAHVSALKEYFLTPVLVASFAPALAMFLASSLFSNSSHGTELTFVIIFEGLWFLIFLLDVHALAYTALWFGLSEPQLPQAITKTVFRVLILPLLTMIIPFFGFFGLFIWPAVWIPYYSKKLEREFHTEACNQSSNAELRMGWFSRMVGWIFGRLLKT